MYFSRRVFWVMESSTFLLTVYSTVLIIYRFCAFICFNSWDTMSIWAYCITLPPLTNVWTSCTMGVPLHKFCRYTHFVYKGLFITFLLFCFTRVLKFHLYSKIAESLEVSITSNKLNLLLNVSLWKLWCDIAHNCVWRIDSGQFCKNSCKT